MQHGYLGKLLEFHITEFDHEKKGHIVDEYIDDWDDMWKAQSMDFDAECDQVEEFKQLKGKMFFVFDGNHRLNAWMEVSKENPDELRFHPRVRCTILNPGDGFRWIEQAMHALNK